jgi:arginine-tRNA-protein transferase
MRAAVPHDMNPLEELHNMVEQGYTFRQEGPCPYFTDGRISTVEFVIPLEEEAAQFHLFLVHGYRRLGRLFYRNVCRGCSACLPIRVEAGTFRPSRSQKRTLRANRDVRVEVIASSVTRQKVHLYRRYLSTKHGNGLSSEPSDPETALSIMHYGYSQILEMNYLIGDCLAGVGIVDIGADAVSSNYFYYDTSFLERRLGVFSILQEITLCGLLGKKYCYLGFCIEETDKMSYKRHFRPNEALGGGTWGSYRRA